MKKLLFIISVLFFALTACSDSTSPDNNDPFITGQWESYYNFFSSSLEDSLSVKLNLTGKDGKLGGTGTIKYKIKSGGSTTSGEITNDVTGTYDKNQIDLKLTDFFNYKGNINKEISTATRYKGTATLSDGFFMQNRKYNDLILVKK